MKYTTTASLALLLLAACQNTPDIPPGSYPSNADHRYIATEMAELAEPGVEHAELASHVGTWDVELRVRFDEDSGWQDETGVSTLRTALGGRYLIEELRATIGGQSYEALHILGYSKLSDRYRSVWMDSMSTWPTNASGKMDEAEIVHLAGKTHDVATPQGRPFRAETMWIGETESHTTLFDTLDGKLVKVMEIRRTRRK